MQSYQLYENALAGGAIDDSAIAPGNPTLAEALAGALPQPPPEKDALLVFDRAPYPPFRWRRPVSERGYMELARHALKCLLGHLSLPTFVTLFSAVCLEKFVIVYHRDPVVVTQAVLALHFMIRPLRWVLGSVSLLPEALWELLTAPSPMVIGTAVAVPALERGKVFVDIGRDHIAIDEQFPDYPHRTQMIRELAAVLGEAKALTDGHLNRLVMATNLAVRDMLGPCEASIMTDMSDAQKTQSKFIEELYLGQAPVKDRPFLREFSSTQMFRHHVEQECRKRSDRRR
jgi:hypothetical protein